MGQARLDYMKDSAWKRGTAKKIDNLPPFELPYAKDAVLIDLVDPDVLPDAQVNFLEMIEGTFLIVFVCITIFTP